MKLEKRLCLFDLLHKSSVAAKRTSFSSLPSLLLRKSSVGEKEQNVLCLCGSLLFKESRVLFSIDFAFVKQKLLVAKKTSSSSLTSLPAEACLMITFRENEKIYLIKRRHKIVLLMELLPLKAFLLIIIILAATLIFLPSFSWPEIIIDFIPELSKINLLALSFFILSLLLLVCWIVLFMIITNYYLDCWIITNERTIHTELHGFFNRVISTVQHDRIQDITVKVNGPLATFFRYGNLKIQTAGGFRSFICQQIPDPYQTKDIIFKAQKEFLNNQARTNSDPF